MDIKKTKKMLGIYSWLRFVIIVLLLLFVYIKFGDGRTVKEGISFLKDSLHNLNF